MTTTTLFKILFLGALITAPLMAQTTRPAAANKLEEAPDVTPTTLPGAEAVVFKKGGEAELRLFVVKPKGWSASDKRPCLVSFFGGGWNGGTPERSIGYARWAASKGMVGVAPDYRTKRRFQTPPEDCVADGRAAVRWIQDHAAELGIDPVKLISLGASAGGHVAAWTAITGPVSPATVSDSVPIRQPAALVLLWPVTDTTVTGFAQGIPFGGDVARAAALSVTDRMPVKMPPTIVFHGTKDELVNYSNSVAFAEKMKANGNQCSLITFPGAPHSPTNFNNPDGKGNDRQKQMYEEIEKFLSALGLINTSDYRS